MDIHAEIDQRGDCSFRRWRPDRRGARESEPAALRWQYDIRKCRRVVNQVRNDVVGGGAGDLEAWRQDVAMPLSRDAYCLHTNVASTMDLVAADAATPHPLPPARLGCRGTERTTITRCKCGQVDTDRGHELEPELDSKGREIGRAPIKSKREDVVCQSSIRRPCSFDDTHLPTFRKVDWSVSVILAQFAHHSSLLNAGRNSLPMRGAFFITRASTARHHTAQHCAVDVQTYPGTQKRSPAPCGGL